MLNTITIMGRFTKDPELRYTQNQVAVASFILAVDRDRAPNGAEKETDFIPVVAWRNTAEFVSKYFSKGRQAAVTGRLQIRKYQDREGDDRTIAEVVADSVYFADSKREATPTESTASDATQLDDPYAGFGTLTDPDGELPF